MIDGPLKADGRLAAKNASKIRAALTQVTNFKSVFNRYQETHPESTDNKAQDRARARSWIMLNVGFNNDALHNAIMHSWAEAYVLGQDAAGEWIAKAEKAQKALDDGMINWDTWKPGDRATALLVKPVGGFARYLEQSGGASYFKKFDKETIEMLGTSLADAIEAGLDSEAAALLMKNHVGSAGRALTIAITEQNRAMSFSTIQRYKEAELNKMEWHVSDPCPKCAQNSGQVIEIGGTFNSGNQQPPAHPHCRCVLLPVIPGMEEPIPGAEMAPMPAGTAHVENVPTPEVKPKKPRAPKGTSKIKRITKLKNWDKDKLKEISTIQDNPRIPVKIWDGGAGQYITVYRETGDDRLKTLLKAQNFDAKPELITSQELQQRGETGVRIYRGLVSTTDLSASEMINQFKTGDIHVGTGVIGNGVYTTTDYTYAAKYAEDNAANVMQMVFKSDAKFVDYETAKKGAEELSRTFYDVAFKRTDSLIYKLSNYKDFVESFGNLTEKEARNLGWLFHDEGAWAAAHGFDAIKNVDDGQGVYVLLNRGAVAIQK